MRISLIFLATACAGIAQAQPASLQPGASADAFTQLQTLSGDWEADLPG